MRLFTEDEFNNAKKKDLLKCKCDVCGNETYKSKSSIILSKTQKTFCSASCSAKYTNSNREFKPEWKNKISNSLHEFYFKTTGFKSYNEHKEYIKNNTICKVCGEKQCILPHVCKSFFINHKSSNLSKLGFDFSKYGTTEIYDEYFKIQYVLYDEYYNNNMSFPDIQKKYNIPSSNTLTNLFRFFHISTRTLSESQINYVMSDKYNPIVYNSKIFKCGWHTSWDNKQHYYRSSYEEDYMKELDYNKIEYCTEKLRIQYFNTKTNCINVAIPDFYIPSTNTIVEVKSEYTYDKQNMTDKVKAYKEMGYNFKFLYEHIMYDYCI